MCEGTEVRDANGDLTFTTDYNCADYRSTIGSKIQCIPGEPFSFIDDVTGTKKFVGRVECQHESGYTDDNEDAVPFTIPAPGEGMVTKACALQVRLG